MWSLIRHQCHGRVPNYSLLSLAATDHLFNRETVRQVLAIVDKDGVQSRQIHRFRRRIYHSKVSFTNMNVVEVFTMSIHRAQILYGMLLATIS